MLESIGLGWAAKGVVSAASTVGSFFGFPFVAGGAVVVTGGAVAVTGIYAHTEYIKACSKAYTDQVNANISIMNSKLDAYERLREFSKNQKCKDGSVVETQIKDNDPLVNCREYLTHQDKLDTLDNRAKSDCGEGNYRVFIYDNAEVYECLGIMDHVHAYL